MVDDYHHGWGLPFFLKPDCLQKEKLVPWVRHWGSKGNLSTQRAIDDITLLEKEMQDYTTDSAIAVVRPTTMPTAITLSHRSNNIFFSYF